MSLPMPESLGVDVDVLETGTAMGMGMNAPDLDNILPALSASDFSSVMQQGGGGAFGFRDMVDRMAGEDGPVDGQSSGATGQRADVVEYAKKFLGMQYKWGGSNPSTSFDCIAEGSLVATEFGDVPIELVRPGDLVLTRSGYRMVMAAWCVGDRKVITNRGVTGTPDHRVWTDNRGWVPLSKVTEYDTVVSCRNQSVSSSTDSPTTGTRARPVRVIEPTSSGLTEASTGPFGFTIMAPSPMGAKSTTLITTLSTTTSRTLSAWRSRIIAARARRTASSMLTSARRVALSLKASPRRASASTAPASTRTTTSTDSERRNARVFDLEVEGAHEFFADGVLVHNCSGFTQYVLAKFGVNIPRVSFQQANYGKRTSLDNLQAGDLVAWDNSSRNNGADHIALYIGGGQIMEFYKTGKPSRIRKVSSSEGAWGVKINYGKG